LHRSSAWDGRVYVDLSNHRWNGPFSTCDRRRPDVYRDCRAGIFRRLGRRPRHDYRNGGDYGNDLRSGRSGPITAFGLGGADSSGGDMLIAGVAPSGMMLRIRSPPQEYTWSAPAAVASESRAASKYRAAVPKSLPKAPQTPVANRAVSTDQVDGLSPTRACSIVGLDANPIIHRVFEPLLTARYLSVVWTETWPTGNWIWSNSPPASLHRRAQVVGGHAGPGFRCLPSWHSPSRRATRPAPIHRFPKSCPPGKRTETCNLRSLQRTRARNQSPF
jgi:hypothetical protein